LTKFFAALAHASSPADTRLRYDLESQCRCLKGFRNQSRTATASAVAAVLVVVQVDPK